MKHILLIESKPKNGLAIIAALRRALACDVTFLTSDLALYLDGQVPADTPLALARQVVEVKNSSEFEVIRKMVANLHRAQPIHAVFTLSEAHMPVASRVAEWLNLPHPSGPAVTVARNKYLTRRVLTEASFYQPRFTLSETPDEAVAAAHRVGFPVILKPIDGYSSLLTGLAHDTAEVHALARKIAEFRDYGRGLRAAGRILVEEYVRGPIVSAEILSCQGNHHVLGLTSRYLSPPPAMIEAGGSFPAHREHEAEIAAMCCRALDVIGFTNGAAHVEVCLAERGPLIIEINSRLVGYYIPELIHYATGIDPYVELARIHLGERIDLQPHSRAVGSIYSLYPQQVGRIRAITPSPLVTDERIRLFHLSKRPGDPVRIAQDNTDRLGFVITVAESERASIALAREVADTTRIDIDPAPSERRRNLLMIDRIGYRRFCNLEGRRYIDGERYALSLITERTKADQAGLREHEHLIATDVTDDALLERLAAALLDSNTYHRILAFSERFLEPAAQLRQRFDIDGMQPDLAEKVRNKVVMKQVLAKAGIRVPHFIRLEYPAELMALLARAGKIVLKPVRGMGSKDIFIIDDPEELKALLARSDFSLSEYQAEEYIDGTMYHINSVVRQGRTLFSASFEYLTLCTTYVDSVPQLDVSVTDPTLKARLEAFDRRVIEALGITQGLTHHEVFVRPDGEIVFCEIANRAGGGAIGQGMKCLYGLDIYEHMIALELDEPLPPLRPHPEYNVAGLIGIPPRKGRLVGITPVTVFAEPWILHKEIRRQVGEELAAPFMSSDGLAFFIVGGRSRAEVLDRLHTVTSRFEFQVE